MTGKNVYSEIAIIKIIGAGGGSRTREHLRDRVLSSARNFASRPRSEHIDSVSWENRMCLASQLLG